MSYILYCVGISALTACSLALIILVGKFIADKCKVKDEDYKEPSDSDKWHDEVTNIG